MSDSGHLAYRRNVDDSKAISPVTQLMYSGPCKPFKAILVAPHSIGDWTESAEKDLS
jgi:hypothetical protein